jgi:hypothetical protein
MWLLMKPEAWFGVSLLSVIPNDFERARNRTPPIHSGYVNLVLLELAYASGIQF